jgi:DNA-binding IclR family transcriptional regulator
LRLTIRPQQFFAARTRKLRFRAISAPIFDSEGRAPYSLTITLTPFRLQAKGREKLIGLVQKCADEISLKLGGGAAGAAERRSAKR